MAFIDELGRKISLAGQNVSKKTREMGDVAKVNAIVSEEEKKIKNYYFQIGQLYVMRHSNNCEPDFLGLIAALKQSEATIAECKKQIRIIKGIALCSKCGAEVPATQFFCTNCGETMNQQPYANKVACSSCGQMIDKNMKFCNFCGKPLKINTQTTISAPNTNNCSNCGAYVTLGMSFCTECGSKMPTTSSVQDNKNDFETQDIEVEEFITCVNCGAMMDKNLKFCLECGTSLNKENEDIADVHETENTICGKKCSNCGNDIDEGLVFCTECGTKQ